jgi:xanthine dehydrogenase accessory factor
MFLFDYNEKTRSLCEQNIPFCTATIVDKRGSIPQIIGARAIFSQEGRVFGTVGGGKVELQCQNLASELLTTPGNEQTSFRKWNLRKDIGMTCAGEISLFFELYRPDLEWQIVVFGAGHVAQTLCRLLIELECRVTCVDTRRDWLEMLPSHRRLEKKLVETYSDGVSQITDQASVVVMTKGHSFDVPILRGIEECGVTTSYLGVIGSKSKAATLKRDLVENGASQGFVDQIICPVGDKIGNNTPAEISFGIISQLLRKRTQETGG